MARRVVSALLLLMPFADPQWPWITQVGPMASFDFDRIYSPWRNRTVETDGKAVVRRSAERYVAAMSD